LALPHYYRDGSVRGYFKFYAPGALLIIFCFLVAFQFVRPAPPQHIVIATGPPEGTYYHVGQEYKKVLAKDGIDLEVRHTAGSVENLRLLEAGEVDIAFLQGGIGSLTEGDTLISLGSLYYEPVWIFYRADLPAQGFADLKGRRINIGADGSGTQVVAEQVLDRTGVTPADVTLSSFGGKQAADMLEAARLDLVFMIYGYQAPVVQRLLRSDKVRLWSAKRAEAFYRFYRHMTIVRLPEGFVDFSKNIPSRDVTLLATTTQLVAPSDIHPALIDVFLLAAEEIHRAGGVFENPGEFPALKQLDFKVSKETRRFYKSGPTFLRQYLPFWIATFVDRMKIMLIPLVALLFPFVRVMPSLYHWRMRSRIYRWYREVEDLDPEMQKRGASTHLKEDIEKLNHIEEQVSQISIPLGYRDEMYDLRMHIDLLRKKLLKASDEKSNASGDNM
jgi:TRAP transporter TAXI family solute receptor